MKTHQEIDARALRLARSIVAHIDADPTRSGVEKAVSTCMRWQRMLPEQQRVCVDEWADILKQPWSAIREVLLDESEEGNRLRQSSPFCGVLSNRERWSILKEFVSHDSRAA
jgi:hypothetical protein